MQEKELFVEALMFTCQGILGTAPLELTLFWIVMTLTMRRMRLLQDKQAETAVLNLRKTLTVITVICFFLHNKLFVSFYILYLYIKSEK